MKKIAGFNFPFIDQFSPEVEDTRTFNAGNGGILRQENRRTY